MKWPASKRHKHWAESECGMYRITKDGDGLLCGWRRGTVTGHCIRKGCGRYQTPCGKEECKFERLPGWIGVGCTRDRAEMQGLLEGTLTEAELKHGPRVPLPQIEVSFEGDIPQTEYVAESAADVDTDPQ